MRAIESAYDYCLMMWFDTGCEAVYWSCTTKIAIYERAFFRMDWGSRCPHIGTLSDGLGPIYGQE